MKQYLKMADVFKGKVKEGLTVNGPSIHGENHAFYANTKDRRIAVYAANAINSHDELVQMNQELLAALEGLLDIVGESDGVSGYHLNGDIAEWGEFEELNAAYDAVNKAKGGAA